MFIDIPSSKAALNELSSSGFIVITDPIRSARRRPTYLCVLILISFPCSSHAGNKITNYHPLNSITQKREIGFLTNTDSKLCCSHFSVATHENNSTEIPLPH